MPITSRAERIPTRKWRITFKVMGHRELGGADRVLSEAMRNRVGASLLRFFKRGTLAQPDGPGGSVLCALLARILAGST